MLKGAFSLTQQARILSFDEARRAHDTRGDRLSYSAHSQERNRVAHASRSESSREGRSLFESAGASSRHTQETPARSSHASRNRSRSSFRRDVSRLDDEAYAASRLAYDEEPGGEEPEPASAKEESRFDRLKRSIAKNRADKAFDRQYGGSDRSSGASDGGPRAAVYKGEMGQAHRRASRMQGENADASQAKRTVDASRIPRFMKRPWFIATAGAAVCIVLTASFLYPSAAQLYHSARERDQLQAEYAAIEQRNEAIQSTVDALSTDAGVEDRAHQEYGWVSKGENAVTVYGLDLDDDSTFTASVVPGSVSAPETWYSKLFGPLFGEE